MWNINRKSGRNWTNTYRYAYILQHCTLILPHPGSPQSLISDEGPNKNTEALINWYYRAVNWTVVGKSLVFKGESSKIPRLILFNLSIYVETQKKFVTFFRMRVGKLKHFANIDFEMHISIFRRNVSSISLPLSTTGIFYLRFRSGNGMCA